MDPTSCLIRANEEFLKSASEGADTSAVMMPPRRPARFAPIVVLVGLVAYLAVVLAMVTAPSTARAATTDSSAWTTPTMPGKCSDSDIESGDVAGCLITSWGAIAEKGWGKPPFPDGSSAWKWLGWSYNGSPALKDWEASLAANSASIGRVAAKQIKAPKPMLVLLEGFLREIQDGGYRINDAIAYNFRCTSNTRKDCQGLSSSSLSYHAYGLAIDINVSANPELTYSPGAGQRTACEVPMKTNIPQWVVQAAEKWGLLWGGYGWSGGCASPSSSKSSILRDPMHFEFRGSVDNAVAIASHNGVEIHQECDDDVCVWLDGAGDDESDDDSNDSRGRSYDADVDRIYGANRYESSAATAEEWDDAETIFLATGENFPDSLAAGPAAARLNVPVLLVTANGIPEATREQLERLEPKNIFVAGGRKAISNSVLDEVEEITGVEPVRISGGDRYETAEELSRLSWYRATSSTVWVASGTDFQDPLIASAAAALYGQAFVLLDLRSGLTADQKEYLKSLGATKINVVAAPGSLSSTAERDLGRIATVEVFDDSDVSDRSASVWKDKRSSRKVALATSQNFPDALSAVPYTVLGRGTPIMLVPGSCVPEGTLRELNRLSASTVTLFGGPAALSRDVESFRSC